MRSADILTDLCPDAGHMNHMPGHIYVLCGDYEKAKAVSEVSIKADDKYLEVVHTMEGYYSMKMHVLVRFGRWQEIIHSPMPVDADLYCVSTAMHHYAKGVAYAALKDFPAAKQQCRFFYQSVARIPNNRKFFNNAAVITLGVAEEMLQGELAYHTGNIEAAFDHLREAVIRDDNLEYTEPRAWMHPPRHALGALLAAQHRYNEAEEVYRTDLGLNDKLHRCAQHPDNVWALHGLVECLQHRGDVVELPMYQLKLNAALKRSDGSVKSSCLCRSY